MTLRPHDAPRGTGRALVGRVLCVHSIREPPPPGRHHWGKRHLSEVGKLSALWGQGTQSQEGIRAPSSNDASASCRWNDLRQITLPFCALVSLLVRDPSLRLVRIEHVVSGTRKAWVPLPALQTCGAGTRQLQAPLLHPHIIPAPLLNAGTMWV